MLTLFSLLFCCFAHATNLSTLADDTAQYALQTYKQDMVNSLAKLVSFNTVAIAGVPATENPAHIAFKAELKRQALTLGLDFDDQGYIVVIGLGQGVERLGIITHGDIQPADASKWKKSPFALDVSSEPGKLIARGSEDNKSSIASVLYAMKAIKDQQIPLKKRIELYVYMAEETDRQPLQNFLKNHSVPQTNITLDGQYPLVTAEKGAGTLNIAFNKHQIHTIDPYISAFSGGYHTSQIPTDALAIVNNADIYLLQQLMNRAQGYQSVNFDFELTNNQLTISALGLAAHSSKPKEGVNAITYLADLLNFRRWHNNGAGTLVNFINDNIGLGVAGKKFGNIAYTDDFMGPMTVAPTLIQREQNRIELAISIYRPTGKTTSQLTAEVNRAIASWKLTNLADVTELSHAIGEPFEQHTAPQIDTLLAVFSHYSGIANPRPIAIAGATNARLFPNAVSFGPSMPNTQYTGHAEHEFITLAQFEMNLLMYTAALLELAK